MVTLGWPTTGMLRCSWFLPFLTFTLELPTKGMLRCSMASSYSKLLIFVWPTKGMPRCNGFFLLLNFTLGAGGLGGAQCPPSSTPDPNKTSVGCKDETAQRGYFQQVDCFVASLVGSCSSSLLWVVAMAVVVVVVAVGSRCCCCGSIRIQTPL